MAQEIIPNDSYLVVKRWLKRDEQTSYNIVLPDVNQIKAQTYEVISIPENEKVYRLGDIIIVKEFELTEFKLNEEEVYLVRKENIMGWYKKQPQENKSEKQLLKD